MAEQEWTIVASVNYERPEGDNRWWVTSQLPTFSVHAVSAQEAYSKAVDVITAGAVDGLRFEMGLIDQDGNGYDGNNERLIGKQ